MTDDHPLSTSNLLL